MIELLKQWGLIQLGITGRNTFLAAATAFLLSSSPLERAKYKTAAAGEQLSLFLANGRRLVAAGEIVFHFPSCRFGELVGLPSWGRIRAKNESHR